MHADRRDILKVLGLTLAGCSGAAGAGEPPGEGAPALIPVLRAGGCVIVMRHASSPRTPPAAAQANPDNSHAERQLDEAGRTSARALGEAWRRLRIPVGPILASPTYRALETARLAQLAPVQTFTELGDQGQSMQGDASGTRGAWLRAQVAKRPPAGSNTVIITHLPNITEAFGADAEGLEDGEALIFRPDGHSGAQQLGRVKIGDWPRW